MPAWNSSWCLPRDFGCIHTKRYIVYRFNLTEEEYMDVCLYDMVLMLLVIRKLLPLYAYIGNPVEKKVGGGGVPCMTYGKLAGN